MTSRKTFQKPLLSEIRIRIQGLDHGRGKEERLEWRLITGQTEAIGCNKGLDTVAKQSKRNED